MKTIGRNRHRAGPGRRGAAQSQQKGRPCATSRARCARQGQVGEEGHPGQESAQGREESQGRQARGRDGSKTARILELLKRPGGVTAKELMKRRAGSLIPYAGSSPGPWARRWA